MDGYRHDPPALPSLQYALSNVMNTQQQQQQQQHSPYSYAQHGGGGGGPSFPAPGQYSLASGNNMRRKEVKTTHHQQTRKVSNQSSAETKHACNAAAVNSDATPSARTAEHVHARTTMLYANPRLECVFDDMEVVQARKVTTSAAGTTGTAAGRDGSVGQAGNGSGSGSGRGRATKRQRVVLADAWLEHPSTAEKQLLNGSSSSRNIPRSAPHSRSRSRSRSYTNKERGESLLVGRGPADGWSSSVGFQHEQEGGAAGTASYRNTLKHEAQHLEQSSSSLSCAPPSMRNHHTGGDHPTTFREYETSTQPPQPQQPQHGRFPPPVAGPPHPPPPTTTNGMYVDPTLHDYQAQQHHHHHHQQPSHDDPIPPARSSAAAAATSHQQQQPQQPGEILGTSGYALPPATGASTSGATSTTMMGGRWYEPNGGKESDVAAAQLAEIRTLREQVSALQAQLQEQDSHAESSRLDSSGADAKSSSSPALQVPISGTPTDSSSSNNMLDILSSAAVNRTNYQPSSPGLASRGRGNLTAANAGGWKRFSSVGAGGSGGIGGASVGGVLRGPRSMTGSNHSEAGSRSSIHELMIGESWGPAPGVGKQSSSSLSTMTATATTTATAGEMEVSNSTSTVTAQDVDGDLKPEVVEADETGAKNDVNEIMWDLLWPGWTKELPDPALMHHIVDTFFTYVPTVSRIFHYETFKTRMSLPPSHANFPKAIVLHAMCAASARYTAQVYTVNPEEQPWIHASRHTAQPAFEEDFGVRHSLYAIRHVHENLAHGVNIYETCQALLLLANHYHIYARWVEGWTVIGMLGRLIIPLGLTGTRTQLLKPSGNVVEREERKNLAWMAVLYDIQSSTSGNWPGCIHFDEMDTTMPTSLACFDEALVHGIPETEQTLDSPDLFTHHPIQDGFQMHLKAMLLLNKVNKFNRRLRMHGRSTERPVLGEKENNELQELDSLIGAYILHFPASLRDPLMPLQARISKPLDIDLFAAQILMHQSTMLLHEPHADLKDPNNISTARLLSTARGTLRMLCLVTSTSLDLGLIVRAIFGLFTAGRVLCLFLKNAICTGMQYAGNVETIRGEIELFHLAMSAQGKRFPLGARHANMLEMHLLECDNAKPTTEAHITLADDENVDEAESALHSIEGKRLWK
ncbi:hypothetical protein QFC21_000562 [Naganishia friedmannii]|uniref:Uncharacterized protein n=1 Tax=Naganishia friedmannii TaxID=89922 RepID=A0ACC2WCW3_9TREE|nr:hypothetical protein QFC21_000562 [Naganishia friedmannii]